MRLVIHEPQVAGNTIIATYTHNTETYRHSFIVPLPLDKTDGTLQRLVRWLALVHATHLFLIDYMTELVAEFPLSNEEVHFFEKLFFYGMAEFRYVNHLPIATKTIVIGNEDDSQTQSTPAPTLSGGLLLNGGGKDGLVSATLLNKSGLAFDLFQIGSGAAQRQAASYLGKQPLVLVRHMDKRRYEGKYSGHRPTSAAIAIAAVLTAYLSRKRDVITSNEASADEATLELEGVSINHQYSKSYEFETDFSTLLKAHSIGIRYFSLLRPLHELQIIKILAARPEMATVFISCNHGFRKGFWCKQCAKCAFVCLATTAVSPSLAATIFNEPNPIALPGLHSHITELVTPELIKPLECVGTLEECQVAARLVLESGTPLPVNLKDLLTQQVKKITQADVDRTLTTVNDQHLIPADYAPALETIKKHLT